MHAFYSFWKEYLIKTHSCACWEFLFTIAKGTPVFWRAGDICSEWNEHMWQEKAQGCTPSFSLKGSPGISWEEAVAGHVKSPPGRRRDPRPKPWGMFFKVELAIALQTLSLEAADTAVYHFMCPVAVPVPCLLYNALEWISRSPCMGDLDPKHLKFLKHS